MQEAIINWMKESTLGVVHWAALLALLFAVIERFLGRSKDPRARSILAAVAFGMSWILRVTRIGSVPLLGTTVVRVLEMISGTDIDGDGVIGKQPTGYKQPGDP